MNHLALSDDLHSIVIRHPVVLIEILSTGRCAVYWYDGDADTFSQHGFAEARTLKQARALAKKFGPPDHALIIVEPLH